MDFLALAQDRYEQLAPLLRQPLTVPGSEQFDAWLRQDVCRVAAQLCSQPSFQRLARWSPDHLGAGADTPERRLVEAADRALVEAARVTGASARRLGTAPPATCAELDWVARRPWVDLVCELDYFQANRELHLPTGHPLTKEFQARYQLRVPLGDYVCRALEARVDFWWQKVQAVWQECLLALAARGQEGYAEADSLVRVRTEAETCLGALRAACHTAEAARREACVTLVHIYAAYAPCPSLSWLGFPGDTVAAAAACVRAAVRPLGEIVNARQRADGQLELVERVPARLCRAAVLRGVAVALAESAALYRRPVEADELIAWTCQSKKLVLVDRRPRAVFWRGGEVPGRWDARSKLWDFLWRLAQGTRHGRPVHQDDLVPGRNQGRALVNCRSRLSPLLPSDLDALILDVRPGGYRLDLKRDEVALLAIGSNEDLVEIGSETTIEI